MISTPVVCKCVNVRCPRTKIFLVKLVNFFVRIISKSICRKASILIVYDIETLIVD